MDQAIKKLVDELGASPTGLSEKTLEKIYRYIPVPNDYDILWADIDSFGGYPSGVVITDRGIVFKASKKFIKEKNKKVIDAHNGKDEEEERNRLVKVRHQIIPWDYLDPDLYTLAEQEDEDGKTRYVLSMEDDELTSFGSKKLFQFFCNYSQKESGREEIKWTPEGEDILKRNPEDSGIVESGTTAGIETINAEGTVYNAELGTGINKGGHGIYAEDVGSVLDNLNGEKSTVTGRDNAKNGPDKLVDGVPIQCKYYKTASSSVKAAFQKDPETGKMAYRYYQIGTDKPMKLEVPKDQYEQAIAAMKKRIADGQVKGVTDPNEAYNIIVKGKLTHQQAVNLAKAGTFESVTFDAVTGVVTCSVSCGISAFFSFGVAFWQTKDVKEAGKTALITSLQTFGLQLSGYVIASQLARTSLSSAAQTASKKIVEQIGTKNAQNIINAFRLFAGKKAISGAAASKSLIKALSSTGLTQSVFFVVFSVPDTYNVLNRRMSGAQYTKNMISLATSFLMSTAAPIGIGIALGKVMGDSTKGAKKIIAKAAGFATGVVAGVGTNLAVHAIGNLIVEDDAILTTRLFNAELMNMCLEYMITENEFDKLEKALDSKKKELLDLQVSMLTSKRQERDIRMFLIPIFDKIAEEREHITEDEFNTGLNLALDDIFNSADIIPEG